MFLFFMNGHKNSNDDEKFKRIRWVKKILRYLPRRASVHNYPVLKHFSEIIKNRSYLWSFRLDDIIPAFYIGWIITLTPIPSICQIIIALIVAILCRANVMILVGLQLLSNPFTFIFLWAITHKVGVAVVYLLGSDSVTTLVQDTCATFTWSMGNCCKTVIRWFATTMLGAIILGLFLGFISSSICKFFVRRAKKKISKLK